MHVVIVGGGQAAQQTIASLRQGGFDGRLTLVGDEPVLPYQRPPLSKAYMLGELPAERLPLRPEPWYTERRVDLLLGRRVTAIDRSARRVQLDDGGALAYDRLVLATGARPRPLPVPVAAPDAVFDLRSLADVEGIRAGLQAGRRLVIVGGGYIGLEAAAVAHSLGLDVTVLERAERLLARVASPTLSEFYRQQHSRRGVAIRTGAQLTAVEAGGDGGLVTPVLASGERLAADLVLTGIGILPNAEMAAEAGLDVAEGIVVDRDARTSDPLIFAAGDCTRRPLVHHGGHGRLESVHNAVEQGKLAAAAILDQPRPAEDCPWFWSDQYDLKLQIAGLAAGSDHTVVRGEPEAGRFALFYFAGDRLRAVEAVNSAPEFLAAKKLIPAGARLDATAVADTSVKMRDLAAAALAAA
ncbi:3-phenylpropionate/trans-cinnamate dioxygenase ferredoxin reductase subunit [Rhodothalassium salexigens DSM 2132]|uniref:3-phenylpropionate/trans-cinnamate dioxygenase ferredoxin reductase subunit n=1 Tax=Rhodothalassium salexigens DSM 2132 TaxID=1188247 RepID=A0A4R2PW97_RHOSA|nr:FAD-dependent oxidoreductase [Rhodothalassium salexigens]MBB4210257.1 3-phenylpropionate/trans-cinnamate dioxygenase ferredoxin reductase subunit [Rhodothalassium salexigens DSM 2132]MBK1638778.1 pyridine nucleotide-disulfide oxidoreductase [Rhodothalassium salexigens DSM 2132]TCP38421.1 3-phenylpropionate/trans-cinnamate dioxygenase ferredoxin reductase subunit [Rhodothalassium salexigens DSM 2132]